MKKAAILIIAFTAICVFGAFAVESDYYARTIRIEQVYPHKLGYKLLYATGQLTFATTSLPQKWFSQASAPKGEMARGQTVWGNDPSYPYMIVFWKNGKFSHVRLFLRSNLHDLSYGVIDPREDPTESFNVDDISLEF